jgi:simple sugar transport system ATP-binding protein
VTLPPSLALSIEGVTKRFGALVANDAIDLVLHQGEILALLGENGAGKTTLMNILFGHYVADAGVIRVAAADGTMRVLTAGSPQAALQSGVGMVHQHFALAESLSVLENIVLGARPLSSPSLGLGRARDRLRKLIEESGLQVRLDARVSQLSVGEKQRVEILKVLYRGARILILDEPTAVLTPQEASGLFGVLRGLAANGLGVIFITHKLGEVLAAADRVAVLRGGRKVADRVVGDADRGTLATLMVGRELRPSRRTPSLPGEPLLQLDSVGAGGSKDRVGLVDVSLTLRRGEIVGIAGVSGNGQQALADLVAGMASAERGSLWLAGADRPPGSPRRMIEAGVARIPEDRHRDGIVGSLSIAENLALETLRSSQVQRAGFLRFGRLRERARAAIAAYDIRCPGPETPIRLLSGGNIQKVILARVLDGAPKLVLANQPTRGLDVGAAEEVHRRLLEARARGAGVLLISEDLDELFALSDRIAVMARGRLTEPEPTEAVTIEGLGLMMAGQATAARAA